MTQYLYQTIENKQKYISQIMTSKSPARSVEDIDEVALSLCGDQGACHRKPAHQRKDGSGYTGIQAAAIKAELSEPEI